MAELTKFQKWVIELTDKGAGLDTSPSALSKKEIKECEALVAMGLLQRGKNHSKDRHGMFIKPVKPSAVPAAAPAAPSAPRRQYYYKDSACKAASPDDPQCICWHDEGTGVYAGERGEGVVAWRAVVSAPAAPDALSRSHELLRQARDALEKSVDNFPANVQHRAAIAAITAYLPKDPT